MSRAEVPAGAQPSRRPATNAFSRIHAELESADPSTLPFLRAFLVGYTTSTLPAIIRIIVAFASKRLSLAAAVRRLGDALLRGASPTGLATAFGVSIGGARWGQDRVEPLVRRAYMAAAPRIRALLKKQNRGTVKREGYIVDGEDLLEVETRRQEASIKALSTWLSATLASLISISLLHSRRGRTTSKRKSSKQEVEIGFSPYSSLTPGAQDKVRPTLPLQRKAKPSSTLDLTLFVFVRATDVLVRGLYEWTAITQGRWGAVVSFLASHCDTIVFQLSCWKIMHAWFYQPQRLPPSYNKWIMALARMDPRLLRLLQYAKRGEYVYGKEPNAEVYKMCEEIAANMGQPVSLVNPHVIKALPCTFVHGRIGAGSCEANAVKRWIAAFRDCLLIYLPVHLVPQILFGLGRIVQSPLPSLLRILLAASRSSAFLATFVASIYASVCLVRSRLPFILPGVPQQVWDSGVCAGLGCFLCGFSVLIENKRRRREMALYCAPRALYASLEDIVPAFLSRGKTGQVLSRYIERLVFAASTGTVVAATVHRPDLVSGIVQGVAGFAVGNWGNTKAVMK